MIKAGTILLILGGGTLASYLLYHLFRSLYTEPDVPTIFKIATPVVLMGLVLLVIAVVRDRLRSRKEESFQGMKT